MELVQNAILSLQEALQKRSACDQATQTVPVEPYGTLPSNTLDRMKHHIKLAHEYMMLHSKDDVIDVLNVQMSQKTPLNFDNMSDAMSEVSDIDDNPQCAIMAERNEEPSNSDFPFSKCSDCDLGEKEDSPPLTPDSGEVKPRKKRKRDSGASDDQSFVMERHNRVYLAYKPEDQCWRFKYVLKDKGETWDEADNTIMAKMRSIAKGGKCAQNAFTAREKLVQLWCDQNKISYTEGEKAAANLTNLELFVAIKKESPGLIKSGIPNPTEETVYQ